MAVVMAAVQRRRLLARRWQARRGNRAGSGAGEGAQMTWLEVLKDAVLQQLIEPMLEQHFPAGVPREVLDAILPDVERILSGEPVNWFELRRLVAHITTKAIAEVEEIL